MTRMGGFQDLLKNELAKAPDGPLAIAVSGGGDSLALMVLVVELCADRRLHVVTVDHGLRAEAAEEAAHVNKVARQLGLSHTILTWQWDQQGNLQDQARRGRYEAMAEWGKQKGISAILVAHTMEDQAETFLMRMARGAGVDGLSMMASDFDVSGQRFMRPLLAIKRDDLRQVLRDRGVDWIEDPSNQDTRFDRVKARHVLPELDALGATAEQILRVAGHMSEAKAALDWALGTFATTHVTQEAGDLRIDSAAFADLPAELRRRLLLRALDWVNPTDYAPRRAEVERLQSMVLAKTPATLAGCQIRAHRKEILVFREYENVKDQRVDSKGVWDKRWQTSGDFPEGSYVAALGPDGLKQCENWRDSGRLAAAAMCDPALWLRNSVQYVPTLEIGTECEAKIHWNRGDFVKSLFTR